jgi:hypothetical protein
VAVSAEDELRIIARERLNFLAIGFYVRGGIMLAFSCFFLIYVAILMSVSFMPQSAWNQAAKPSVPSHSYALATPIPTAHTQNAGPPPVIFFRIMAGVMGAFVILGWAIGALSLYAGKSIQKRRRRALIYVMAGANCFFIPYGILLGIFTFIIMGSPEARREFEQAT